MAQVAERVASLQEALLSDNRKTCPRKLGNRTKALFQETVCMESPPRLLQLAIKHHL